MNKPEEDQCEHCGKWFPRYNLYSTETRTFQSVKVCVPCYNEIKSQEQELNKKTEMVKPFNKDELFQ